MDGGPFRVSLGKACWKETVLPRKPVCQEKYSSAHAVSNVQSKGGKLIKGGLTIKVDALYLKKGKVIRPSNAVPVRFRYNSCDSDKF